MGKFHDILNVLGDPEAGIPEDALTSLMSAYDEDMSIPGAKVAEMEAANAELNSMVAELKARNYDLMISSGSANGASAGEEPPADDEPEDISIDDLFGDN